MLSPKHSIPGSDAAIYVLFDTHDKEQAEILHKMCALLQERSDIEAVDERWFILRILPGGAGRIVP